MGLYVSGVVPSGMSRVYLSPDDGAGGSASASKEVTAITDVTDQPDERIKNRIAISRLLNHLFNNDFMSVIGYITLLEMQPDKNEYVDGLIKGCETSLKTLEDFNPEGNISFYRTTYLDLSSKGLLDFIATPNTPGGDSQLPGGSYINEFKSLQASSDRILNRQLLAQQADFELIYNTLHAGISGIKEHALGLQDKAIEPSDTAELNAEYTAMYSEFERIVSALEIS